MEEHVGKIPTCVTLTPECKKMLKVASKKKGISQSAVMELAIREIVERWTNQSELIK